MNLARAIPAAGLLLTVCVSAQAPPPAPPPPPPAAVRLHGVVEPVRSYTVSTPRLTGGPAGPAVAAHRRPAGRRRHVRQEGRSAGRVRPHHPAAGRPRSRGGVPRHPGTNQPPARRAPDGAGHARHAAEAGRRTISRSRSSASSATKLVPGRSPPRRTCRRSRRPRRASTQLTRPSTCGSSVEAADMRILEIQRERAKNAWKHAAEQRGTMRIIAPLDGLVVLRSVWKNGTMAEVQEGEEVRAGHADSRRRRSVGDARPRQRQPGRHRRARRRPDRRDHARLVSRRARSRPPRAALADRHDQHAVERACGPSSRCSPSKAADPHLLPDLAAAVEITPVRDRMQHRRIAGAR